MIALKFLGHSCFQITNGSVSVIIDPFLNGNPKAPVTPDSIKVSHVILTHGHGDHIGDGIEIAKANNATVIAPFELATYCETKDVEAHAMHIGGGFDFPFGRVKLTQALHGSAVFEDDKVIYTGNPCGVLLTMDGKTIYHAGDTGLFGDMKLIGDRNRLDAALLPIGDNFTMGIDDALYAVELLHPHVVIPMHYNTFPIIEADPHLFAQRSSELGFDCTVLDPGTSFNI